MGSLFFLPYTADNKTLYSSFSKGDGFMKCGSVPVAVAARVYGKDASWVRAGIVFGWLPIGYATRNGQVVSPNDFIRKHYGRINYYISPAKLFENTGYIWEGEKK